MNVTFACPRCEQPGRVDVAQDDGALICPRCGTRVEFPPGAWHHGKLSRCLVCPSEDLFIRKDFPQRLGVAIVVVGFLGSTIAWYFYAKYWAYGILFATAIIDLLLYRLVGDALACYRCHAHYRQLGSLETYRPFSLETHEKHRQQQHRQQQHRQHPDRALPAGATSTQRELG